MARDLMNRAFRPTIPDDLLDPPRFSQIIETTKDAFVVELRRFISNSRQTRERRIELPTIEKYASFGDGNDPASTAATIVRKFPDRLEALPHIAVMASSGSERKLSIGPPFVATVQDPARVVASLPEPYALADGDLLDLRTLPDGRNSDGQRVLFTANRFPTAHPIGAALAADVAAEINAQSLHAHASVFTSGNQNYLQIECGGPADIARGRTPTELEVGPLSSDNVLTATGLGHNGIVSAIGGTRPNMTLSAPAGTFSLADVGRYVNLKGAQSGYFNDGRFLVTAFSTDTVTDTLTFTSKFGRVESGSSVAWFIGARDDFRNPIRPPKHRFGMSWDLSVEVNVLTEDENTRGEVVDLILAFFSFFLESQYFTFLGRSGFQGQTTQTESYQIVLQSDVRSGTESEVQRPGDNSGKVYINAFTVNVTTSMYLDREVLVPGTQAPFIIGGTDVVLDETLPLPATTD